MGEGRREVREVEGKEWYRRRSLKWSWRGDKEQLPLSSIH